LTRWAARRHGADTLPLTVHRRRIYIIPTRFGVGLSLLLAAMLLAGLNYNSNLGLAFGFLMTSLALVAMHHCHRNLLGLTVDVDSETEAFAGARARFDFVLRNDTASQHCDIEIRCGSESVTVTRVMARSHTRAVLEMPTSHRGVVRHPQFEMRTRFPFGWFRAWTYVQSPLTVFVAPRPSGTRPLKSIAASSKTALYSELRGDEEFAGLRTYAPGMPLKHMAWKVLARGAEPAVRSYTGPGARPEWLDWSSLEDLDVEARLSQLCRWLLDSETERHACGLRMPGTEIDPGYGPAHRSACLRALARFGDAAVA